MTSERQSRNMTIWIKLFWLLVGHAVADYPLQGDFLAKAKNAWAPIPEIDWRIAMAAHCAMHAGVVMLVTHSFIVAMAEFILHFGIDVLKCAGKTNFRQDQAMHVICKVAWAIA
jgi:hypothetical protein